MATKIGAAPGALRIPEGSPPPRIRLMDFDERGVEEREVAGADDLRAFAHTRKTTWIDIQGLGDEALLREIGDIFGIHRLALADAVNIPQRAKAEEYDSHLLVISRAPEESFDASSRLPQVCILISGEYVISFQERYFGFFDGVRERIHHGAGLIRSSGPAYLGYALIDALVDQYFPVVARVTEELDDLDVIGIEDAGPESVSRLHDLQRRITSLRRVVRPQVEALYKLSHDESAFIPAATRVYLQDAYDHARQIEGRLDSAREMAVDTMSALLAMMSHRQNETMKVLTLVGSIFIPLTFIAGIYGMNFEYMPELQNRLGYPVVISVMAAVAVAMFLFFRHKGWIGNRDR
jgi:magnesium transporter